VTISRSAWGPEGVLLFARKGSKKGVGGQGTSSESAMDPESKQSLGAGPGPSESPAAASEPESADSEAAKRARSESAGGSSLELPGNWAPEPR
jgi:hypothetical protein